MFLEDASQFSSGSICSVLSPERVPERVSRLLKEINLLRKDSRDAGLDEPSVWHPFVSYDDCRWQRSIGPESYMRARIRANRASHSNSLGPRSRCSRGLELCHRTSFATARPGMPSTLKSPTAIAYGPLPTDRD